MASLMRSNRRPLRARLRSCFHQGSIKFSHQAHFGMNNTVSSGQAIKAVYVSREVCVLRLSVINTHSRAG
jgi:hypothetical protein